MRFRCRFLPPTSSTAISQHSAEDVCAYLKTVHRLINEAADDEHEGPPN